MSPIRLFGRPNIKRLKAKGNVQGLIEALSYERDSSVRKEAVKALGEIGGPDAIEPLTEMLLDKSTRKAEIIKAIERIGGEKAGVVIDTYNGLVRQREAEITYIERTEEEPVQVGTTRELEKVVDTPPGTITKDWMLEYVEKPVYGTRTTTITERQYPDWDFEETLREKLVKLGILD